MIVLNFSENSLFEDFLEALVRLVRFLELDNDKTLRFRCAFGLFTCFSLESFAKRGSKLVSVLLIMKTS